MKTFKNLSFFQHIILTSSTAVLLSACGGGGSSSNNSQNNLDTEAPVILLIGDSETTVPVGGPYSLPAPGATVTDNKDTDVELITSGSISLSIPGTYTFSYDAEDAAGNKATTVTRTITVVDNSAPVISLVGDSEITLPIGSSYIDQGANAIDDVDQTIEVITSGTVNTSTPGIYTISYNAEDSAGNQSTTINRTVTIVDNIAPVISLIGSAEITVAAGESYTDQGATVADNIDETKTITSSEEVDITTAGTYTLRYNTQDNAGNDATEVTRIITVVQPEKGIFEDSKVIGLSYETPTIKNRVTNDKGEFEYLAGETITFKIGDIILGSALGAEKITTFDIGDSLSRDETTGEYNNLHIATLLQSLDNNQNPADGFIDLTGMVGNPVTGITLEGGITQEKLDTITNEVDKATLVSSTQAASHAMISLNEAIIEENGTARLTSVLTQADFDAGYHSVFTRIGHQFTIDEPVSQETFLNIESDVKIQSHSKERFAPLRIRIDIFEPNDTIYMGLGIFYSTYSNSYRIHSFIDRNDPKTDSYTKTATRVLLPAFDDITIERDKTYKLKLQYNAGTEIVSAYIDDTKIITWDITNFRLGGDSDGEVNVKTYVDNRVSVEVNPETGKPNAESIGASLIGIIDNLLIKTNEKTLLSEDFEDNSLDNPNINYSTRKLRAQTKLSTNLLTKNSWYVTDDFPNDYAGQCHAKITFKADGTASIETANTSGEIGFSIPWRLDTNIKYTIDAHNKLSFEYPLTNNNIVQLEFNDINSESLKGTSTDYNIPNLPETQAIRLYKNREEAIKHAESLAINYPGGLTYTDCETLPE